MACVLGCGGEREQVALLRAEMPFPQDSAASLHPDVLRNNDDELAKRSSLAEEYWETFFEREALDSVVVSRTDYRSAQRDLHPDTVFEELEGMFERETPLGLFLQYWGVACSALVLLAVFIWLARALVCSVRGMGKRCMPSRSGAQNKRVTQSRVSVQTPAEEEKEVPPYGQHDVFEKVGYVLPFKAELHFNTGYIVDSNGSAFLTMYSGISVSLSKRIVNLLNKIPSEEKFPFGILQFEITGGEVVFSTIKNGSTGFMMTMPMFYDERFDDSLTMDVANEVLTRLRVEPTPEQLKAFEKREAEKMETAIDDEFEFGNAHKGTPTPAFPAPDGVEGGDLFDPCDDDINKVSQNENTPSED